LIRRQQPVQSSRTTATARSRRLLPWVHWRHPGTVRRVEQFGPTSATTRMQA